MRRSWLKLRIILEILSRFPGTVIQLWSLLNKDVSKRLKQEVVYYSCLVPTVIGKNYLKIVGVNSSSQTNKLMIYGAAIIPIIDHINDHMGYDKSYLEKLYRNSQEIVDSKNDLELIFKQILKIIGGDTIRKNAIEQNLGAQLKSLDQYLEKDTSKLKTILADKGGLGMVQYFTLLNQKISRREKEVAYQIGYWLQLVDDEKDMLKDIDHKLNTLATLTTDFGGYKRLVYVEKKKTFELIRKMDGDNLAKEDFINVLNLIN